MTEIEKIAANRYRLRAHDHVFTVDAQDLLDVMDYGLRWAKTLEQEAKLEQMAQPAAQPAPESAELAALLESGLGNAQAWQAIQAQAQADLEAVQTDTDAYAFIERYMSKDLQGRYMAIYRSDRHEMLRTPRQALDNLLSLPPLE